MRITQVEYRRLVTHGDYANTTVGATGLVGEQEHPDIALAALEEWVDGRLSERVQIADDIHEKRHVLERLEYQVIDRQRSLAQLIEKWKEVKGLLEAHGVTVEEPRDLYEGMPF